MRLFQWCWIMRIWPLISFLGVYSTQFTTIPQVKRGIYLIDIIIDNASGSKILANLTNTDSISKSDSTLDLSGLELEFIVHGVFDGLAGLKSLDLSNNNFQKTPTWVFYQLNNLETLSFANNKIKFIIATSFVGLNNLKTLDLSNNRLTYLDKTELRYLPKSTAIIMKGNRIFYFGHVQHNPSQPPLEFPWDGHLWYSSENIVTRTKNEALTVNRFPETWELFNLHPFYVRLCQTSDGSVEYVRIAPIWDTVDTCLTILVSDKTTDLHPARMGLEKFQSGWYQIPDNYFSLLDLYGNNITEITPELLNDLPEGISVVRLVYNKIKIIRRNVIDNRFLKVLSLNSNFISIIENGAFENTNLEALDIESNQLTNIDFARTLPTSMSELLLGENEISEIYGDSLVNLRKLVHFIMPKNRLTHLSANAFRGLKELRRIDLEYNHIKMIELGAFADNGNLADLGLSHNRIKELPDGLFDGLKMIEKIELNGNRIKKISRNTFSGIRNVLIRYLRLDENEIETIEAGSFANMIIQILYLDENKLEGKSIEKGAFKSCQLFELTLNHNLFTSIAVEAFSELKMYGYLGLSHNMIDNINKGDARYMTHIRSLHLGGNGMTHIKKGAFYGFPKNCSVFIVIDDNINSIQVGLFDDV